MNLLSLNFGLRASVLALCSLLAVSSLASEPPRPLPHHPGNIFIEGEEVNVPPPFPGRGHLLDYDDRLIRDVADRGGNLRLGKLPLGWYRVVSESDTNRWVSLAVLSPPIAAPSNSPVSVDVAMSWFYPTNRMADAANVASLAGVNWVRDRLSWGEMEPRRGTFARETRYDAAARVQTAAGLKVLQVNHSSPRWAGDPRRFPTNLFDAYNFYREMARRWRGQVLAFEPWNEADISGFGGHTGAEMASLQKAACLGLKAGNPDVIACMNVWAVHRAAQLQDFAANHAEGYFDTYNLHHYEPIERYPELYADHRAVSAGKPMWVTEFAMPVKWAGDAKLKELNDAELRRQSERLVKAFAGSLFEGAQNSFYFMLPHYVEGQTQFGIIRPDLSPRPAYCALAAVSRLLGPAHCLGRLMHTNSALRAYAFRDGNADILVAWCDPAASFTVPAPADAVWDHIGRAVPSQAQARSIALSPQPRFIRLPRGVSEALNLQKPPLAPARVAAVASPLVLQPLLATQDVVLAKSAWKISSERPQAIRVAAYNFGTANIDLPLIVSAPAQWKVDAPSRVVLAPGGRAEMIFNVDCRAGSARLAEALTCRAGESVLSIRLMPDPARVSARHAKQVVGAAAREAWTTMISSGGKAAVALENGELVFQASLKGADRWFYPRLVLGPSNAPPPGAQAIAFKCRLIEGSGTFRAIVDERNGSGYVMDLLAPPQPGRMIEAIAPFDGAQFGEGWSKPDSNHRFDPDQAAVLKIGCNTKADHVKFAISDLRWVTIE